MTKSSPFSVRGRRALLMMKDERDIAIVRRQLGRLGMAMDEHDLASKLPSGAVADVILLDADLLPVNLQLAAMRKLALPIVALVGTETPSHLKCLLDLKPASVLIKPLRTAGLYTALVVAFDHAQRRHEDALRVEKLEERVRARRIVFTAVLQVMQTQELGETAAFALIRRTAMQQRMTVEQLCGDIVASGSIPQRVPRTA